MGPEFDLRIGGRRYTGRHVDLDPAQFDVEIPLAKTVVRGVRSAGPLSTGDTSIRVAAPTPGQGHDALAMVPSVRSLRERLAGCARSLGHTASVDADLAEARTRLTELSVPDVDLKAARRRVADASGEEERLRERVAALRGRVEAHREFDGDAASAASQSEVESVEGALREATATLSKVETERIAAEQALSRAVELAREARDVRERRLKLEDAVANREREARRELATTVYPAVRDALEHVPGGDRSAAEVSLDAFSGDRVSATLAAIRVADLSAPVVLALPAEARRFPDAESAATTLETPVIRIAGGENGGATQPTF